ncbi:hypothetical protein Vafri_1644 [Volvox africanus]|nr:hypothetical protein Vafri_1644 [Volvox africanus]
MPVVRFLGLALALLFAASQVSDANADDSGARQTVRQGYMVILRHRKQPGWRRQLLRNGPLPVFGSTRELGYFYTVLDLGTPTRSYSVIIDTGSTITYIPCKGCENCGKHQSERFDPDTSATARRLLCGDPLCNCGSPSCMCVSNNQCYYKRAYAEGSVSEGYMITDVLNFPDGQPPVNVVFGCVNGERGELYRQMADGLMGMGNNNNAFQSQLVANGVIDDVFSLCFGFPRNGVLLLGDVPLPEGTPATEYTPLLHNMHLHFYNVRMEGIEVLGERLPLDAVIFERGYGTVLDSGTTFTYLPSVAFEAMSRAVGQFAEAKGLQRTAGADPQYNDVCWRGAPDNLDDLDKVFPYAEFVLGGNVRLRLRPSRYLFLSRPAEYCLSIFDNGGSGTLIGTGTVQDILVTYDRRNNRVGFTDTSCVGLAVALAGRANTTVPTTPSPPPFPPPPSPSQFPSPQPPAPHARPPMVSQARKAPSPSSTSDHPHPHMHHKVHHHPSGGKLQKAHVLQRSHWLRLH